MQDVEYIDIEQIDATAFSTVRIGGNGLLGLSAICFLGIAWEMQWKWEL